MATRFENRERVLREFLWRSVIVSAIFALALVFTSCAPGPAPTATPVPPTAAPAVATAPVAVATAVPTAAPSATPTKGIDYPVKGRTITMIVPYAAGGGGDIGARLLAPVLEKELGTNIEVVNKPGAGSQIGITELVRAKPDGYTIGFTHLPAVITIYLDPERQAVFTKKDLQPLAMYVIDPNALGVKGDSQYKSIKDIVEAAKAAPGKVIVSDSGILSDGHISILRLQQLTGVRFAIVHSEGGAKGVADLLGGHTHALNMNLGGANVDLAKSGQIRVLAIFDKQENPNYPGVTTATAQGYPINVGTSRAISAPAGTPKEIVDKLTGAIKRAMESAELKQKAKELGLALVYMSPSELDAYWAQMEDQIKPIMQMAKE